MNNENMKLAFVFPGQGSQSVGMLDSFADNSQVHATLTQANAVLGQDIAQLIQQGPAEELALTVNTQPVMLSAGIGIYRAWLAAGGAQPVMLAGHSLGEYTALVAAGSLRFEDALHLVRFRAQAMQEAVPAGTGGMAAILGLKDNDVRAICAQASQLQLGLVEAVNFNAPTQIVIAGTATAVAAACQLAKEKGAKRALILPVSAPFHSSLLASAGARLRERLADVVCLPPTIEVINNVDVKIEHHADAIKSALVRQASAPVRWVETIQTMVAANITHIIECGPGKVLTGLTKQIAPHIVSANITDPDSLMQTLTLLGQNHLLSK